MFRRILAIDAGNSRVKFGLFVPSRSSFYRNLGSTILKVADSAEEFPCCREFLAIPKDDPIPWQTLASWQPEQTVIAGSNPQAVMRVLSGWPDSQLATPLVVRDRSLIPVSVNVEFPEKVGLDRLLNAVAANALRPSHRTAIVVDAGTATTVNLVSSDGVFSGGAILPGLEMSAKALNHYTAALPLVPVHDLLGDCPAPPGRNTLEAIRNGLFWGQVGSIRELIRQTCLSQKLNEPDVIGNDDRPNSPWIVLTGGGGPVLSSQFPGFFSLPSLGMHGLVLTAWKA